MPDHEARASQGLTEFRAVSKVFSESDLLMLGSSVKEGLDANSHAHHLKGQDADGSQVRIDLSDTFRNSANKVAAYGFAEITSPTGEKKAGSFYYSEQAFKPAGM